MTADPYPDGIRARNRWVSARRGAKSRPEPGKPVAWFLEQEPSQGGTEVDILTVLLANRECPWRCVYCDLWRRTFDRDGDTGDVPSQIDVALACSGAGERRPTQIKLYNAGSFFDPTAIPPTQDSAIVARCARFERVVVESHPRLIGDRCWRLRDRLRGTSGGGGTMLEVAMGLETVNEPVLARLNRGVTLRDFERAALELQRQGVGLRAFVLVQPPFERPENAVRWAVESVRRAFDWGARVVSLIPTRTGNGALDELERTGEFTEPTLAVFEDSFDGAVGLGRGLVLADLWEFERFGSCADCRAARRERLARTNSAQRQQPAVSCVRCGTAGRLPGVF